MARSLLCLGPLLVLAVLPAIGYLSWLLLSVAVAAWAWIWFDENGLSIHDRLAGTKVVRD